MDYREWQDGERAYPARPYPDPAAGDDPPQPAGRPASSGRYHLPSQREHRDDRALARPYVPDDEAGWSPPDTGRHRQRPTLDGGSASALPQRWSELERRWRPTLDPTDWRYATGEIVHPHSFPPWADGHSALPASGRGGSGDAGASAAGRHRDGGESGGGSADTEQWARPADWLTLGDTAGSGSGQPWDRFGDTGAWDQVTDTGAWDRFGDTGAWDQVTDTGEWLRDRYGEPGSVPRDGTDMDSAGRHSWPTSTEDESAPGNRERFWSGVRLAGDDPRWMTTPNTAPRSPAVSIPEGASLDDPRPPAGEATSRRTGLVPDRERASVAAAVLATLAWYVVPALVLLAWVLTQDGSVPADCAVNAANGCESARAQATATVVESAPRVSAALGTGLVTAILLRWATRWRSAGIGLAAAVIGGGLSTLVISLVTGQPLG